MHLVSLHIWFWDDSKVCGTKKRDKTTSFYSNLCRDDMREPDLERTSYAQSEESARIPCGAVACGIFIKGALNGDVSAAI
ncbi:hypothetical protein [Paraburkholderia diazotrophica]|uniref:hypothetical protein n=1 Tax=Paraburkholderia diazotrophica TaxID=667676 RepID=UPI000B815F92|nr:hypothetical protein [Paraburkholderia diazotrophica]